MRQSFDFNTKTQNVKIYFDALSSKSSQHLLPHRSAYQWGVNHQLKGIVNELTGVRTAFGYDEFSNLVWSNQGRQFEFLHRSVGEVGNLYETKEKKDRVYGTVSRLLETTDATFSYDEEGNLVQKVEKKSGDRWQYSYYGNGMLAKVMVIKKYSLKVYLMGMEILYQENIIVAVQARDSMIC